MTRLTALRSIPSAAAVSAPEDLAEPTSNSLKRRQSEEADAESSSKRQRTSPGKTPPKAKEKEEVVPLAARPRSVTPTDLKNEESKPQEPVDDSTDGRRRSSAKGADEKQRSKRLFGALLGNLNRPSDRTSKRRAEIEQRKKAELQKQDDERVEDRQRRLERLAVQRKKEQINVDERNMHVRHQNLLNHANFLQTRAEPKIRQYYRPWDLLSDEEDLIDQQMKDAQDHVDRELVDWEDEKQKRLREIQESTGRNASEATSYADAANTAKGEESSNIDTLKAKHNGKTDNQVESDADANAIATADANADASASAGNAVKTTAEVKDTAQVSPQRANSEPTAESPKQDSQPGAAASEQSGATHQIQDQQDEKPNSAEVPQGNEEPQKMSNVKEDREGIDDDDGDHVVEGDEDDVIY
ncbi:putative nuclear protein SDK3 [Cercospora zeina]